MNSPQVISLKSDSTDPLIRRCVAETHSRLEFWTRFINEADLTTVAELGVFEGNFAATVLKECPRVARYFMVDPWKHLEGWNKPANVNDLEFERIFETAKAKTESWASKRVILRGKTSDVIDEIAEGQLDFAYIDGDHTLRGITIDLIRTYSKIRIGGFIGGDDFGSTIWAHGTRFEPTLVFPFAVYFAEAVGATIYALPHVQFCLQKPEKPNFKFIDLTGLYADSSLGSQLQGKKLLKLYAAERFPRALAMFRSIRGIFG